MIKLLSLRLENFMSIESLDMEFGDNETIAIAGENGAGKSTVMAALAFLWTGYRQGESYKDYIQLGHEKAYISHEAIIRGEPISFEATIYDRKYGAPVIRTILYKGQKYINTEADELFKTFDLDYLDQIMFLFQDGNNITDMRPGERAKLLKHLFHFDFTEQVNEFTAALTEEMERAPALSAQLQEASQRTFVEEDLLPILSHEEEKDLEDRLKATQEQLASIEVADQLTDRSAQILEAIAIEEERLEDSKRQLESARNQIVDINALTEPVEPLINIEDLNAQVAACNKQLVELGSKKLHLQSLVTELTETVKTADTLNECHVCGSSINEEHKDSLRKRLLATEEELHLVQQALDASRAARSTLDKEVSQATKAYQSFETLKRVYALKKEQIPSLQYNVTTFEKIVKDNENRIAELTTRFEAAKEIEERVFPILEKKAALEASEKLIKKKLEFNKNNILLNTERLQRNNQLLKEKVAHHERIESIRKQISKNLATIDRYKKAIAIYQTEFPNYLILSTCGLIEAYINDCVKKVFPKMSVKLQQSRSGVEFYYTPDGEGWLSVKMASGAQRAILALSWRIAIAKRYQLDTILFDEVDKSMTDDNSKLIYEFIASLDTFKQIVLISHRKAALRAVYSLADNVSCYWVSGGTYSPVDDPENL
jgi:DNA repair exonuclease SbcCD ATPase subunit